MRAAASDGWVLHLPPAAPTSGDAAGLAGAPMPRPGESRPPETAMHPAVRLACLVFVLTGAPPTTAADRDWTVLIPERLQADEGVELTHLGDGVVLAAGANPATCTYEIDFRTDLFDLSAFRVEALTHPSLPGDGPGRADAGNFVLSEFQVDASRGTPGSSIKAAAFRRAAADHFQSDATTSFPPELAVDGIIGGKNGWAGEAHRFHENRVAVFATDKPVGYRGATLLTVRLVFRSEFARHSIGSFRISTTANPDVSGLMPTRRPPAEDAVSRATERGIAWLLDHQQADGSWAGPDVRQYHGMTALAIYTLIQAGVKQDHPAVRAAASYIRNRPIIRTYDAGCALMAYKVIGEDRPTDEIAALTSFLLDMMGNGSKGSSGQWGYPFGHPIGSTERHVDLSNTQYALLGLRAAASCGQRVPVSIWETAARDVMELQDDYGGFRYKRDAVPGASMTVAGMSCLLICNAHLPESKRGLKNKLDAAVLRGQQWLGAHWSVDTNLIEGDKDPAASTRWYYYYMYGLERVGSLANERMLAGHDWYAEGARALIARQGDDGSWSTNYGEKDANTCFALMFLIRGSSTTGRQTRPDGAVDADADAAFAISTSRDNPLDGWVGALGTAVSARLDRGESVRDVVWFIDGEQVAVVAPSAGNPRLDRFAIRTALQRNGDHEVRAVMRFAGTDGADAGMENSATRRIRVDSVEESGYREAIADNFANLIDPAAAECEVSSQRDGQEAALAIDGKFGTSWVAGDGDNKPTLSLRLRRPVRANVLKLTAAQPYLGGETVFARPREIEVQLNGGQATQLTLIDNVDIKQHFAFPRTGVSRVRIRILSTWPGDNAGAGFKEIELLDLQDTAQHTGFAAYRSESTLLAPNIESGSRWRYAQVQPPPDWNQPAFDDAAWTEGEGAFGGFGAERACRTPWNGPELWLRRTLQQRRPIEGRLVLEVCVDDQAELFLNGRLAAHLDHFTGPGYRSIPVPPEVQAQLGGPITIAVHVKNTGGPGYIDVGLREVK